MAKPSRIDWPAAELLFFSSDLTLRELAEKVGIPYGTIAARAARHKWQDKKDALRRGELPIALRPPKTPDSPQSEGEPIASDSVHPGDTGNQGLACLQSGAIKGRKTVTAADMVQSAQSLIASEAESYRKRMAGQAKRLPDIMEGMDDLSLLANADRLEKLDKLNRRTLELDTQKQAQPLIQIDLLSALSVDPLQSAKTVLDVSTTVEPQSEETASQPVSPDDAGSEAP